MTPRALAGLAGISLAVLSLALESRLLVWVAIAWLAGVLAWRLRDRYRRPPDQAGPEDRVP